MNTPTEKSHLLLFETVVEERTRLATYLTDLGYNTSEVETQEQAMGLLAQCHTIGGQIQDFDLIIFGPNVPDATGLAMTQALEHDDVLCNVAKMVVASLDSIDRVTAYIKQGADDFLPLPFHPLLWQARINANLDKKRLYNQQRAAIELVKIEHDVQTARQIQHDFLPDEGEIPQPDGWQIATRFQPARQVAGDFYDVFELPGDKIGLVVADVCDKGVGPALFMALSRTLIRAFAAQHRPLGWMGDLGAGRKRGATQTARQQRRMLLSAGTGSLLAVKLTNDYIASNHGDMNMFATLFFGVLDPQDGVLTYVNAGHDPPALAGPDGVVKTRLMPTGPAVGMLPDMDFEIQQITLEPGDILLAFSDGAFDARNPAGERFSVERLLSLLQEPYDAMQDLVLMIERRLYEHIAEASQYDDITLLAVRREIGEEER